MVWIGWGRSRIVTQFYFAIGVLGSPRHAQNHPLEKKESHDVSSLVMIGCVIKPEDKTRSSDVLL